MSEQISGGGIDLSHLANNRASNAPQSTGSQVGAPQPGPGQTVDVPSLVIETTEQTFEQIAQLSSVVPVVINLRSSAAGASDALSPVLEKLTHEFAGRVLLSNIDVAANPGIAGAFQVQAVPTVVALIGGRPVPLFQGAAPEDQVRDLFQQLVQLAEQQGVTGRVNAPTAESGEANPDEPVETPPNPAHADALAALERGEYAEAVSAYERVLAQSPADAEARAALVQVRLLNRLDGLVADEVRSAAGERPTELTAQLQVADLDVSGGHVEDAFLRLLDLFAATSDEHDRTTIRERLLELFEVVGAADPRVMAARTRLANLLY